MYLSVVIGFGRFTATDEIAFKAAGREWAQHGRFAAPELTGFGSFTPPVERIWFAHLPVYTFAFGLFVKVAGFGAWQSNAFDALIHVALALLVFRLTQQFLKDRSRWPAFGAALLVLPISNPGRADELATCLGLGAILMIGSRRFWTAGLLFGLCAATSSAGALLLGLCAVVPLAQATRSVSAFVRAAGIAALAGGAAAVACLAPILITHPDALAQFGSHASEQFATTVSWGLTHSWIYGKQYLLPAVAALVVLVTSALSGRENWWRFAGPASAVALVLILVPAKSYYLWFVTPLLFAAAVATLYERRGFALAFGAFLLYGWGIFVPLRQQLIVVTLPEEQRLAPNAQIIRAHVPAGSTVLASEFWSAIGGELRYRSLVHANVAFDEIDYVLLVSNGGGAPGEPQALTPAQREGLHSAFEVVHDNLPQDVPRLLGIPLSRSSWGFGVRILHRRNAKPEYAAAPLRKQE